MLNIYNEGFISYINLFLLLTLHYSVGFSQILIQILIFHYDQNHQYLWTISSVIRWSYLGGAWGDYLQNLKVILKIWQKLKKIVHDQNQFLKSCCVVDSFLEIFGNLRGQLYLRTATPFFINNPFLTLAPKIV